MTNIFVEFTKGATGPEDFPRPVLPEIAFVGRSNVGKSSLLNSLILRKNLAHTSNEPGKTRQINFYRVEKKWSFVDLPGFGYAAVSKEEREFWSNMNLDYLRDRKNLQLVCLLMDSRHDPMEIDLGLIEWLEDCSRTYVILLTKIDKVSSNDIKERVKQIKNLTVNCKHLIEILPYSAKSKIGREQLIAIIKKNV